MKQKNQPNFFANLNDKLAFLAECISDVEHSIKAVQTQHKRQNSELEEKIIELQSDIYCLDFGDPKFSSQRRSFLESHIKSLEKEKRQSKIFSLQEVHKLERELRSLKKEYRMVRTANFNYYT